MPSSLHTRSLPARPGRPLALAVALAASLSGPGCGTSTSDLRPIDASAPDFALDPNADLDDDGFSPAMGDCNDRDPAANPAAMEVCGDHIDQNCDGKADEACDNDKDGYSVLRGDCDDGDALRNPGAFEVWGNFVDDNCDGKDDEIPAPCDQVAGIDGKELAGAIDLCAPWLLSSTINNTSDPRARAVLRDYGLYKPAWGRSFVMLSTGIAADANDPAFVLPQPGTLFMNDAPNPAPMPNMNGCGMGPDEAMVHDYVEWTLTFAVPSNAKGISFDFLFVTAEYPEYVCTQYNDKFLALLTSKSWNGNVSFDAKGKPVTVNVGFFDVCTSTMNNQCSKPISRLAGTGYERFDYMDRPIGGGTDWLHTTAPVTPGETATLKFILFDEGDHKFDSSVIIDHFRFELDAAMTPSTVG